MKHGTSSAISERAQVILVWMKALGVEIVSYLQRVGITRVRASTVNSLWHPNPKMPMNTPMGGLS